MLGCLLIAFNLCAPPGYYGGSYAYAQSGYYVQPAPVVVYQPQPIYYAQPVYGYGGGYGYQRPFVQGPSINVGVGPRGGVNVGVGF